VKKSQQTARQRADLLTEEFRAARADRDAKFRTMHATVNVAKDKDLLTLSECEVQVAAYEAEKVFLAAEAKAALALDIADVDDGFDDSKACAPSFVLAQLTTEFRLPEGLTVEATRQAMSTHTQAKFDVRRTAYAAAEAVHKRRTAANAPGPGHIGILSYANPDEVRAALERYLTEGPQVKPVERLEGLIGRRRTLRVEAERARRQEEADAIAEAKEKQRNEETARREAARAAKEAAERAKADAERRAAEKREEDELESAWLARQTARTA
jgi:hypothetical protein